MDGEPAHAATAAVVRDLFSGKRTYRELADSPEGIPTNILADRLKRYSEVVSGGACPR
jgi:DNA-binding HxlR family transcriptional regulator